MRASWDLDSQKTQEFECEVTNLPFFLLFIWIGATFASACSFVLGYNILENVLENQIPFENLVEGQNQIPFETLTPEVILNQTREHVFMDNVTVIEGILKNNQKIISAQNENRIYDSQGVLCLGFTDFGIVNVEEYKYYLRRLSESAIHRDGVFDYTEESYKDAICKFYKEENENFERAGIGHGGYNYHLVAEIFSEFSWEYTNVVLNACAEMCQNYDKLGIVSEIADQKRRIIWNYSEGLADRLHLKNQHLLANALLEFDRLLVNEDYPRANKVLEELSTAYVDVYFEMYQLSVELRTVLGNLVVIHGQEGGVALEMTEKNSFFETLACKSYHYGEVIEDGKAGTLLVDAGTPVQGGQRLRLRVPRVLNDTILCDDFYLVKE